MAGQAQLEAKARAGRRGVNIEFDVEDLSAVLRQMAKETRYKTRSILYLALKIFTERAQRETPLAPKRIKTFWWFDEAAGKWRDVRKPTFPWGTWGDWVATPFEKSLTRSRGYARQAWREIRIRMGRRSGGTGGYYRAGDVRRRFDLRDRTKASVPFIEGANQIPYIAELDRRSSILRVAMHNTTVKMLQQLTRHAKRLSKMSQGR